MLKRRGEEEGKRRGRRGCLQDADNEPIRCYVFLNHKVLIMRGDRVRGERMQMLKWERLMAALWQGWKGAMCGGGGGWGGG